MGSKLMESMIKAMNIKTTKYHGNHHHSSLYTCHPFSVNYLSLSVFTPSNLLDL